MHRFLLFLLLACAPCLAERPNIIHILADDLGYNDLGCYGQRLIPTPNLDRMAGEGLLFANAYAGSTVCAPSRAALLTGQHTGHAFMRGNGPIALRAEDVTVAELLRTAGYATAMIGKSSVGCDSHDADLPHEKGFDYFFGTLSHRAAHRQYPRTVFRNRTEIELTGNEGKTGTQFANQLYVEDAIRWISQQDRPFFLHLSLSLPHADLQVPDPYRAPFVGKWKEKPHRKSGYFHQDQPKATYAGMVTFLDAAVGKVLDHLRTSGRAGDTLVIFTSDNGPHYEGGAHPNHFDSNGPFRGGKRDLFEGGIRVPQIAWWPGVVTAGQRTAHLTAFWDFLPTVCELADVAIPAECDGISIVPVLTGRGTQRQHEFLYWEFHEQGGKQAVRFGQWKGIRRNVARQRYGPIELYDLERDPGERKDVAAQHPKVVARIEALMQRAHRPSPRFRFGAGK